MAKKRVFVWEKFDGVEFGKPVEPMPAKYAILEELYEEYQRKLNELHEAFNALAKAEELGVQISQRQHRWAMKVLSISVFSYGVQISWPEDLGVQSWKEAFFRYEEMYKEALGRLFRYRLDAETKGAVEEVEVEEETEEEEEDC